MTLNLTYIFFHSCWSSWGRGQEFWGSWRHKCEGEAGWLPAAAGHGWGEVGRSHWEDHWVEESCEKAEEDERTCVSVQRWLPSTPAAERWAILRFSQILWFFFMYSLLVLFQIIFPGIKVRCIWYIPRCFLRFLRPETLFIHVLHHIDKRPRVLASCSYLRCFYRILMPVHSCSHVSHWNITLVFFMFLS